MSKAFHISNLGSFSGHVAEYADMNGYVPTEETGAWDLSYDHGSERTHDESGELTEYGVWWEEDRFPEIRDAAVAATEKAEAGISDWQSSN